MINSGIDRTLEVKVYLQMDLPWFEKAHLSLYAALRGVGNG